MASNKKEPYSNLSLSVFFPAYNEEENIKNTVEKAVAVLKSLHLKDYEVLVIDDGSKDKTGKIVRELQKGNSKIHLITHNPNKGYGEALKSGFYNSKFPLIVFTDSDGQFDFSEVSKFLDKLDEGDLVVGYRINRQDPPIRKLNALGWKWINRILMGTNVRDLDCAFKLVKKEVIENIPKLQSSRGGMISPELLTKAKKAGFKIVEVGVHHYPRTAGSPTGAGLKVIIQSFVDLFNLWRKLK